MKGTGSPNPPQTGQYFLLDFSLKARELFFTPKRHLNLTCTALPARKDRNLVAQEGLLVRNYIWALSKQHTMESFPENALHSICALVCKEMMLTAHPALPAGGRLLCSHLR